MENGVGTEIAFLSALLLANGVFALAEMAMVSSRQALLEQMRNDDVWGSEQALRIHKDPNEFLSTVQIGITLVGVLAGAYGGATLSEPLALWLSTFSGIGKFAPTVALVIVVGVITYLSLVIGELVPKRVALQFAERIACVAAPPMTLLGKFLKPLVWVLDYSGDLLLKPFGIHEAPMRRVTAEEVQQMARQGHREGEIEDRELGLVERAFSLSERPIRALMTHRSAVEWLDPDASAEELRTLVLLSRFSRFPVARESLDKPLGIVNARDLLSQLASGGQVDISRMLKPPPFFPDSISVLQALQKLRGSDVSMALVVDQYGSFIGVITLEDLLGALLDDPLSTTGDDSDVQKLSENTWEMDGRTEVQSVQKLLQLEELPGQGYVTLGGMVMAGLGKIPALRDSFVWEGFRFEVKAMEGRRVEKVFVRRLEPETTSPE